MTTINRELLVKLFRDIDLTIRGRETNKILIQPEEKDGILYLRLIQLEIADLLDPTNATENTKIKAPISTYLESSHPRIYPMMEAASLVAKVTYAKTTKKYFDSAALLNADTVKDLSISEHNALSALDNFESIIKNLIIGSMPETMSAGWFSKVPVPLRASLSTTLLPSIASYRTKHSAVAPAVKSSLPLPNNSNADAFNKTVINTLNQKIQNGTNKMVGLEPGSPAHNKTAKKVGNASVLHEALSETDEALQKEKAERMKLQAALEEVKLEKLKAQNALEEEKSARLKLLTDFEQVKLEKLQTQSELTETRRLTLAWEQERNELKEQVRRLSMAPVSNSAHLINKNSFITTNSPEYVKQEQKARLHLSKDTCDVVAALFGPNSKIADRDNAFDVFARGLIFEILKMEIDDNKQTMINFFNGPTNMDQKEKLPARLIRQVEALKNNTDAKKITARAQAIYQLYENGGFIPKSSIPESKLGALRATETATVELPINVLPAAYFYVKYKGTPITTVAEASLLSTTAETSPSTTTTLNNNFS